MLHQPGTADGTCSGAESARRCFKPGILRVIRDPTRSVEIRLGGFFAFDRHAFHEAHEGQMALGEMGAFGGPVVHLQIDVGMEIPAPRGRVFIGPDALQVARQRRIRTRAGDDQMAAKLEIERGERGIGCLFIESHAFRRGQRRIRTFGEFELTAIHVAGVILGGIGQQFVERRGQGFLQSLADLRFIACVAQIRACRNQHDGFIGIFDGDAVVRGNRLPTAMRHGEDAEKFHAFARLPFAGLMEGQLAVHHMPTSFGMDLGVLRAG